MRGVNVGEGPSSCRPSWAEAGGRVEGSGAAGGERVNQLQ
jgi:hypothetical protein